VFVGVAISNEEKGGRIESVLVISDGTSVMRSERSFGKQGQGWQDVLDEIVTKVEEYAKTRGHKVSRKKREAFDLLCRKTNGLLLLLDITD